ncbi:unnamed protein product [Linum trigynum]|uniref:Retroviral polymerase SH3-like domain-containing protein n=1 Tax=Linum trigynum TaxID=586398 RepID=A0AAV2EVD2_9ROSI
MCFHGCAATQKAYRVYELSTRKVFATRDVTFHEDIFPFQHGHDDAFHWVPRFVFETRYEDDDGFLDPMLPSPDLLTDTESSSLEASAPSPSSS